MLAHCYKQITALSSTRSSVTNALTGARKTGISAAPKRTQNPPLFSRYLTRKYMVPTFQHNTESDTSNIVVTAAVAERIKELQKQDDNKKLYLRIVVDSGGCNGFLAKFELDDKDLSKEDIVVNKDGAHVVLDELSMGLMKGSSIDFVDEMSRSTFVIVENPNAGTSCGCNTSFSLKDQNVK